MLKEAKREALSTESVYDFRDFLGKKVLIMGDVRAGKTKLLIRLLEEAIELNLTKDITVIDLAPKIVEVEGKKIGGKLSDFIDVTSKIRYLTTKVVPPRITAKSGEELLNLVNLNKIRIERLLEEFLENPTSILFVNDISIYLQSGEIESITSTIKATETFIANGYYGKTLEYDFSTGVSERERRLMEELTKKMDITIKL